MTFFARIKKLAAMVVVTIPPRFSSTENPEKPESEWSTRGREPVYFIPLAIHRQRLKIKKTGYLVNVMTTFQYTIGR